MLCSSFARSCILGTRSGPNCFNILAIGVSAHTGPTSLPDGKESTGILIQILTNDRPYRVLKGIEYAEAASTEA